MNRFGYALAALLLALGITAKADLPAQNAFKRMQSQLQDAASITGRVDVFIREPDGNVYTSQMWFRALKPMYYELREDWREVHCDSTTIYELNTQDHTYASRPARNLDMNSYLDLPGLETFTHGGVFPGYRAETLQPARFQGLACSALTVTDADQPGCQRIYYLAPGTDLPIGVKIVSPDSAGKPITITARYHDLKLDAPMKRKEFAWKLPADAKPAEQIDIGASLQIGAIAPAFTVTTLSGQPVALSDLLAHNKVVLLNFWSYFCGPCRFELPHLQRLADKLKPAGLEVLTVDVYDIDAKASQDLFAKLKVSLPIVMDGKGKSSLRYRYGITAVPCNYLLSSDGKVLARIEGWNEDEVLRVLKEAGISAP